MKKKLYESIDNSWKSYINEDVDMNKVKKVINYTNHRLVGWYKNAKLDYGVVGKGKASYDKKTDEIVIKYTEDGKTKEYRVGYFHDEPIDYVFNVWGEQG